VSKVLEHYHYLHEIPELGFQEVKTSAYIADQLEKAGLKVTRNINNTTGIVAEIDSGAGSGAGTARGYGCAGAHH
jgi:amidohydrolase